MFSVFNLDSMGVKSTFYSKAIENNALDGCPGIEKEGRFQRRKAMGRDFSVIHGSPIGKPYPSSVASLRSLDFSNLAN